MNMINLPIQSSKTCSKRVDENKIPEVQAQEVYLKTFMGLMNGRKGLWKGTWDGWWTS